MKEVQNNGNNTKDITVEYIHQTIKEHRQKTSKRLQEIRELLMNEDFSLDGIAIE